MTFNKTDNLRVGRTRSIHRDNPPFLVEHHKTGVSVNIVLIAKILLQELLPLRLVLFQLCFPRLTVSIHRNADNLNTRIVSEILSYFFHIRNFLTTGTAPGYPHVQIKPPCLVGLKT